MQNNQIGALGILFLSMTTPVFDAFDAEQTASTYSPDAIVIGTFGKQLTIGSAAIVTYFKGAAAAKIQVKLQDSSTIELSPDAVAIAGFYEFSFPKDGQMTSLPARYSFAVFKRDGVWKTASPPEAACSRKMSLRDRRSLRGEAGTQAGSGLIAHF